MAGAIENPRVKKVDSLAALANAAFGPGTNAIVFPRRLTGDFAAVARILWKQNQPDNPSGGVISLTPDRVQDGLAGVLQASFFDFLRDKGPQREAARRILADMAYLEAHGFAMRLRLIPQEGYRQRGVESFHADGILDDRTAVFERALCCYLGAGTEFIANESATSSAPDPQTYIPRAGAVVERFSAGDFWRHAPLYMKDVPPFIHRAPDPGHFRMLLVARRPVL